jgi:hypothetical protein
MEFGRCYPGKPHPFLPDESPRKSRSGYLHNPDIRSNSFNYSGHRRQIRDYSSKQFLSLIQSLPHIILLTSTGFRAMHHFNNYLNLLVFEGMSYEYINVAIVLAEFIG